LGLFSDIRGKTVVDGYSGTGTLALLLSGTARKVIAIETESEAVADGIRTAEENGIKNIDFICGNVEEKLPELVKQGEKIDGILFDPPRKGIEREALLMLGREKIPEIVYISCDPATFARDAGVLFSVGYRTDRVFPFDMFPNTAHVECVARFYKTDEKEQKLNTGVEAS
ncbi:MAG: RsmD family RNA methyltransferase, partial [Fusobacteriaceae bacterium]|jgi:23S rRNA (uracil1939-C5)-methyltransferase|nr:RsmD family RNA methyltransferase [Fusobacteriaceae bacterium]